MKRKSYITLLVCVLFVAVLAVSLGLSFSPKKAMADDKEVNVRIAHISDLHFYPEEMSNAKSIYYQAKVDSENKFVGESGASLRKTFESMVGTDGNIKDDAPMIVLVSGDLTLNGEKDGHKYLAQIFKEVTEMVRKDSRYENFQILVIPGNHDIFNTNAMRYYPTEEELNACATPDEREELLVNYKQQAETCDNESFIDIYWSFGYAPKGEINKNTGEESLLASNITLDFFYDSEYWYEDDYGLKTVHPPKEVVEECEETKDYSLVNEYVRHGACSYIARTPELTVVSVDANSREYIGKQAGEKNSDGTYKFATSWDWEETTSGDIEDRLLRWITTSIKEDVQNDRFVVGQLHHNVVPHFGMEGDIFSMFTYDDYKKVAPIFADAGLKYVFTGHMHASDIANYVSQNGNVIYDMETGTPIGLGAAYRIFEMKSKGLGANYTEDVYTKVINLDTDFDYFTADSEEAKHFVGGHFEYFSEKTKNMVTNVIESYVNEGLYAKLEGIVGDKVGGFSKLLGGVATDAINDLANLDLYPIVVNNGKIGLGSQPKEGYDLICFAEDLVDYIVNLDLSFGTVSGGYKLSQVVYDVYGGHLLGTNPDAIPENLVAFFAKLEDGTFVQGLVDLLYNTVVPQLDLILNAPIRYKKDTPTMQTSGVNGLDISASYDKSYGFSLDGVIKSLLDTYAFGKYDKESGTKESYDDENGYTSLKKMVKAIADNAPELIESLVNNDFIKPLIEKFNIKELYDKYFGMIEGYLKAYFDGDLASVIKNELLDKYVTKAFCVNLGVYAKDIVESIAVDTSYDGGYFDENGNLVNEKVHLQYKHNGVVQYAEHSFSKTPVEINPSSENGLLPAQVAISNVVENGEISATQMKLRWTTHITVDIFENAVPDSFIVFAKTVDGLKNAVKIKANGENVNWEYPTIDLGIHYLNLTYVYDTFNLYNVKLTGLDANTTYYYMLGNDKTGWTEIRSFRTAKTSDANSYTVMGITDIQGSIEENYTQSLPNLLLGKDKVDADMVITLGDNVDNGKSIYQYYWMLEGQKDFWSYIPFVGVPGNHEDGENELSTHVPLPNETTGKEYYSFFYVNTMYIMLDTNDLTPTGELSETQYEWLVSTLDVASKEEKVKWIIVGMHKGLYTAGSHAYDKDVIAMRAQLSPVFSEYGVDLVLQGHDHTYSVTAPLDGDGKNANATVDAKGAYVKDGGVIYINLGTMGDKFYDYIYSEAIGDGVFLKRDSVDEKLSQYLTSDKNLELTETPVFMDLTVTDSTLSVKTYTVVNGETIQVDNIVVTSEPAISGHDISVPQIVLICVSVCAFIAIVVLVVLMMKRKTAIPQ